MTRSGFHRTVSKLGHTLSVVRRQAGILFMSRLTAFIVLAAAGALLTPAGAAEKAPGCQRMGDVESREKIALSGTLFGETQFGPPGYGANPKTDRRDRIGILRLDDPLRVDLTLTEFHEATTIVVKEVQVVPAKPAALNVAPLIGKHVVIKGELFEPNGDDHVRPILIFADSGQPGGRIACGAPPPGK
jgi:hypothetical protein